LDERTRIDRALAGDAAATRSLVTEVLPIVQARVARALVRRRGGSGRDVRQEVEDLAQEVFVALFADAGRVLRAWDPSRGLSLASFCGLVAEREAASVLRSGKRSPWKESATEVEDLERDLGGSVDVEPQVASREQLALLGERVREELSPRGLELFHRLLVEEESVESVCRTTGMSADAVYAWRSRLGKLVRKIAAEIAGSQRTKAAPAVSDAAPSPRTPRTPREEEDRG
jgi:DNA-directed RNA polymerase specialized sigma24 family protein